MPHTSDEIGALSESFTQLCDRLDHARLELDTVRDQAFRNEKLASLGQLTAGIAHEVNNPLGGMLNCVKSMQADPDNIDLKNRYLILLDKGLRRIEHTMQQLLNFGRTDPLHLRKGNIDEVIRECLELLKYRLHKIDLKLDLQLPRQYCIDIEAVKQIVMNISLNAIQAMPTGGFLEVISLEQDNHIILSFTDNGTGMAPETLKNIFDPFFTTKDVGEGTGLGLSVSHKLVTRMNGAIEVDSMVGSGSRFTITLPIKMNSPVII